jgi:hypothetical protein
VVSKQKNELKKNQEVEAQFKFLDIKEKVIMDQVNLLLKRNLKNHLIKRKKTLKKQDLLYKKED